MARDRTTAPDPTGQGALRTTVPDAHVLMLTKTLLTEAA